MDIPRPPQQEMTTRDNRDILGTLSSKGWSRFQTSYNRALFFDLPGKQASLERSLMMTGAINGEHRKDLVEALRGQKAQQLALAIGGQPPVEPRDGRPRL
ncbi:MAG: hypothetical protein ACYC2H_06485 [Thermoplasmatota archaeon]